MAGGDATPTAALGSEHPPRIPAEVRHALAETHDVLRELGRGGMGTVYLARERALDRDVAIKVLAGTRDAKSVQRFLQEARLSAQLRHPNIVSIHAVGEAEAVTWFSMDYVDGETLDALRRRDPLSPERCREVVGFIAQALAHAHGRGVVHRDLKPGNVMLDGSGHVLVMDFGLAKIAGSSGLSTSGIIVGTPQYMSPEQIEGKPATVRSDIYALGLLHVFLLLGRDPVEGGTLEGVISQHLAGAPARRVQSESVLAAEPHLAGMVARDPESRFGSLEEVLETLRASPRSPLPEGPDEGAATVGLEPTRTGDSSSDQRSDPRSPISPARREARERVRNLLARMPKKKSP